jgi:hypothetical protein
MTEYTYSREWIEDKTHWDIGYCGEPVTLAAEIRSEFDKPCTVVCDATVCIVNADLTTEENTTLDALVAAHKATAATIDNPPPQLDTATIMRNIMMAAEPEIQFPRLMAVLDNHAAFMLALDAQNYLLAKSRVQLAYDEAELVEEDYILVMSQIP